MELVGAIFQIIFNAFLFLFNLTIVILSKIWPLLVIFGVVLLIVALITWFSKSKK